MERLRLNLLGPLPEDFPPSPGAELLIYLTARPGWRSLEEVRRVVPDLAAALKAIKGTPYDAALEAQGTELRLNVDSDLLEYWDIAYRDLDRVRELYDELAKGFESPLPSFQTWLEKEREETLRGLWGTAVGYAGYLADQRRLDEAEAVLEEMEASYPLEPRTALDLADLYWRMNRPAKTAAVLEAIYDRLHERVRPRAQLNLGAAKIRAGEVEAGRALLEDLIQTEFDERYWALLHLGGIEVLSGEPEKALERAREVRDVAERIGEAELYLMSLLLEGEALIRMGQPKAAAAGPLPMALGFQEMLGRPFTPVSLALLAEAQALWGKGKNRAREQAEKAFRRARELRDAYGASRALFALHLATGEEGPLLMAIEEAKAAGHQPWQAFLEARRTG